MKWKKVSEEMPPLDKRILIWRKKYKKYSVVRPQLIPEHAASWSYHRVYLRQEFGGSLALSPEDLWLAFPYVEVPQVYD